MLSAGPRRSTHYATQELDHELGLRHKIKQETSDTWQHGTVAILDQ